MAKTYAAFYLPPEEKEVKQPNQKNVDRIKGSILQSYNKIQNYMSVDDIKTMAKNIDLQSTTEFTQRYAVGALSKIINGEAVTNKTMLDSLFNTYAPALNAGLAQTGFNSLVEMRNAVQAGNGQVNVANFVQGFSNGLSAVQNSVNETDYSKKYGEEIPIDVVTSCEFNYTTTKAYQKIEDVGFLPLYIDDLDPVTIKIFGHVKNENAELWGINDFNNKLVDAMMSKKRLYLRVGKSIYENCTVSLYKPTIENIYNISFEMDIKIEYRLDTYSEATDGKTRIMNPPRLVGDFGNFYYNMASSEVYKGIITS